MHKTTQAIAAVVANIEAAAVESYFVSHFDRYRPEFEAMVGRLLAPSFLTRRGGGYEHEFINGEWLAWCVSCTHAAIAEGINAEVEGEALVLPFTVRTAGVTLRFDSIDADGVATATLTPGVALDFIRLNFSDKPAKGGR